MLTRFFSISPLPSYPVGQIGGKYKSIGCFYLNHYTQILVAFNCASVPSVIELDLRIADGSPNFIGSFQGLSYRPLHASDVSVPSQNVADPLLR